MTLQSWVTGVGCILLTIVFGLIAFVSALVAFAPGSGDLRGLSLVIAIAAFLFTFGFGALARDAMLTNPDDDDD